MYDPKGNSKDKSKQSVEFVEAEPPSHLRGIVHRYLDLRTTGTMADEYRFHALPDACAYVVLDQLDTQICGVTKLRASAEEFSLGKSFHYVNIRFLPGVWQGALDQVAHGMVNTPYGGDLPLVDLNKDIAGHNFEHKQKTLSAFVESLIDLGLVIANPVTEILFQNIDEIHSVADMAELCDLSPRQLQRTLKRTTGFAPHDFFKILRLQQALSGKDPTSYADQSHFIHSFRKATGYTPAKFSKKFDV